MKTKLFFIHIPKTAGTSVRTFLENKFSPDQVFPGYWLEDFQNFEQKALSYTFFRGHVPLSILHEPIIDLTQTITFLREPVERAISHVNHILNDQHHFFHSCFKRDNLLEVIKTPEIKNLLSNFQTRFLGIPLDLVQGMTQREFETFPVNEKIFENAMSALDLIDFVGISEHLSDSLNFISMLQSWTSNSIPRMKINAGNYNKEGIFSRAIFDLLHENNKYDKLLYDAAYSKFQKRLNIPLKANPAFNNQICEGPYPKILWISGFGLQALDRERLKTYMFMDKEAFCFYLCDGNQYKIEVEIIFCESQKHFENFSMSFNGFQVELERERLSNRCTLITGKIERHMFFTQELSVNILHFKSLPGVLRPEYLQPQSVAISRIALTPI